MSSRNYVPIPPGVSKKKTKNHFYQTIVFYSLFWAGCVPLFGTIFPFDFTKFHDGHIPGDVAVWLESGEQGAITSRIAKDSIKISGKNRRERLYRAMHYIWQTFSYDGWLNTEAFRRTADELFESRILGGCSDFALVEITLFRAVGIPSRMVITANVDWIYQYHQDVNLGLIGTGLWFRKHKAGDKLLRTALVSAEAQLFTEGITGLAKFAVGRNQPGEGEGKSSFDPFHDLDRSFPSGHAARCFAVAAVFADRYEQPIPIIVYSAASLISISRIYDNDHFASDVLAGASLGFLIGKALSYRHRNPDSNWTLLPFLTNDRKGLGLSFWCRF